MQHKKNRKKHKSSNAAQKLAKIGSTKALFIFSCQKDETCENYTIRVIMLKSIRLFAAKLYKIQKMYKKTDTYPN